ncbi:MAG: hypothetical protein N2652_03175 [Kiritimatiellae bacterium]|nr:hypothetical protein [Kiritimatiellia bacterium]
MYEISDLPKAADRFIARIRDLVEVLPRDDLAGQALSVELEAAHRRFVETWNSIGGLPCRDPRLWQQLEQAADRCLHLIELLWRTQMLHPPRVLQILAHGRAFADALAQRRPAARRGAVTASAPSGRATARRSVPRRAARAARAVR